MQCIEWSAVLSSIAAVFLASRNSVHTWWTSIVGSLLFAATFFQVRLYADVTLQFFYIGTSVSGWYYWQKGGNQRSSLPITHVRVAPFFSSLFLSVLLAGIYAFALHTFTNASYPLWDSIILVFSILGQLLLMKRKIENWMVWLVVDVLAAPLYFIKGLHLTAALYVWFCCNAVYGYVHWRRLLKEQGCPSHPMLQNADLERR